MTAEDIDFWTKHCIPTFSLLKSTGSYTDEQIASHIDFVKNHVIPCVGPRPKSGADYLLAHTGSIIEISVNFTDSGKPIVRFIFQPHNTGDIPQAIGADMIWADQLAKVFCATEEEMPILRSKLPPSIGRIPQCLLGFDLHPERRGLKVYYSPLCKRLITGDQTDNLVFESLKNLKPLGDGLVPALDKLKAFRDSVGEEVGTIDVIGVDAINPQQGARIKIYTRMPPGQNSFDKVEHHLTLGGRINSETVNKQIELLRGVWHLLLDEQQGFTERLESKPELGNRDAHSGIMVSWEVQPGKAEPSPKLYVPLWKFSNNNKAIAENYQEIFEKWSWKTGNEPHWHLSAIEGAL